MRQAITARPPSLRRERTRSCPAAARIKSCSGCEKSSVPDSSGCIAARKSVTERAEGCVDCGTVRTEFEPGRVFVSPFSSLKNDVLQAPACEPRRHRPASKSTSTGSSICPNGFRPLADVPTTRILAPIRTSKIVCLGSTWRRPRISERLLRQRLRKDRSMSTKNASQHKNQTDHDGQSSEGRPRGKGHNLLIALAVRLAAGEFLPRFVMGIGEGFCRMRCRPFGGLNRRADSSSASRFGGILCRGVKAGIVLASNRLHAAAKTSMAATIGKNSGRLMGIPFPAACVRRSAKGLAPRSPRCGRRNCR